MAKEWRQRCSSNQERENHAWFWPLLDDGQAAWVVRKLVGLLRKEFYEPPVAFQPGLKGQRWMPESPDHHRTDCEACLADRCPRGRKDLRRGQVGDEPLEDIKWVLLDSNEHQFGL